MNPGRLVLAFLALAACSSPLRAADVEDERFGIAFDVPRTWWVLPERPGEAWRPLVALADRTFPLTAPGETLRPTFQAIVFPRAPGEPVPEGTVVRHVSNPYETHDAWLRAQWGPESFEIVRDAVETIHGSKARVLELRTRKQDLPHRRVFAALYALPGISVLLEVDLPAAEDAALERELWRCVRSLKDLGRATPLEDARVEPPYPPTEVAGAERRHRFGVERAELAARDRACFEAGAARGYPVRTDGPWRIASDESARVTGLVARGATGVDDWLDDLLGPADRRSKRALRVFAETAVANAYAFQGTPVYLWAADEVVCTAEAGLDPARFGAFATAIAQQRFAERQIALWPALPPWLAPGITWHLEHAQPSRKRGLFLADPRTALSIVEERARRGRLVPARDLLARPRQEVLATHELDDDGYWAHGVLLTRLLLELPRARRKFLDEYLERLVAELDEHFAAAWHARLEQHRSSGRLYVRAAQDRDLRTERFRAREFAKDEGPAYRAIHARVAEATFAGWNERAWQRLDDGFQAFVANGGKL